MNRWQNWKYETSATILFVWTQTDVFVRRRLALALGLVLGSSVLVGVSPVLLKMAVDALSAPHYESLHFAPAALVIAYSGTLWLAKSSQEGRWLVYGRADQRLQRRISRRLFAHIMALPLRFHLDRKSGALGQTLNNGLLGCRMIVQHLVCSLLPVLIEVVTMTVILLMLGQPIFLTIIVSALICYTGAFAAGAVCLGRTAREASTSNIAANGLLTDNVLNYETVKSFNAEEIVRTRFDTALERTERHWNRFYLQKLGNGLLVATIFLVALATSLVVATRAVSRGDLSVGEFVLVHTYLLQTIRPLEMVGFALRDIAQGSAFIEKMAELLRERPEDPTQAQKSRNVTFEGDLVIDHVSLSYRPGSQVIRDVSFSIPSGHTVAVVGPSGSGKSSLVRLLLRFCEPDSGQILLDNTRISDLPVSQLRDAIALVPQDVALFNESIAYNIEIGRPGCPVKDIERAARIAQLHDFIASLADGYETIVGERGVKLSGGERQRIAIARAILKNPRIFIFDEATSSLDSATEQQIVRNLSDLSQETTTLIVAHRLSTVTKSDEIVVLDNGRVAERGTHSGLLRGSGVYASLWAAQQHQSSFKSTALEIS